MAEQFRTCPTTGLKVHLPAETLIKVNAVAAVVCLLVGGLAALLILLTRWPAIHLLDEEWFYRLLTAHALDMLIAWIIFFEVAGLYFGSTVLLNNRLPAPKVGWVAFILMVVGGAFINYTVLVGQATVAFTSYVPLKASPLYYLGIILFAVGALTAIGHFFAALVVAKNLRGIAANRHLWSHVRRNNCSLHSSARRSFLYPDLSLVCRYFATHRS